MAHVSGATEVTLWGSGAPRREFIHAEDIAGAVIRLLTMKSLPFDPPVNVGSGVDHSIRELAEIIARVIGFRGTIRWDTNKPDGAPRKLLDSARMRSTGWQPLIDLERGLHETYGWYRDNLARVKH
jgi:GDP-L-fucose synthase